MKLENLKTIRDRLNANKSRLAQETCIKLTKTLNHEYIQELEELIQEDQEKLKNMKEITTKHIAEAMDKVFKQEIQSQIEEMKISENERLNAAANNFANEFNLKQKLENMYLSEKIQEECDRQDQKWGVRNQHPLAWLAILMEEVGEVTQEVNDAHHEISRMNLENYRTELVQCGAVIQQMIKNIQHYEKDHNK